MSASHDVIVIFLCMANLEQSGNWIPEDLRIKFTLLLTITFYITKTENRTKNVLTQFSHYCFE